MAASLPPKAFPGAGSLKDSATIGHWSPFGRCALCGKDDFEDLFTASDPHYRIPGRFKLVRCRGCSLVFLNPRPDLPALQALYPEDTYYAHQNCFVKPPAFKTFLRSLFLRIDTKDPPFSAPGALLDVGCGSGAFMNKMRAAGWRVRGVEISPQAVEIGRRQGGLDIFCGTVREAAYPDESFDYIRLNHCLEHILDPNESLQEIRRILKPSGKLLIGVPNIDGMTFRVFGPWWYYLCPPIHIFHYTPKTLSSLLEKNGFIPEKITYNSNYHGLLEGLQIFINRGTSRTAGEGWAANSRVLRILAHRLAKIADAFKAGDCIEIVALKRPLP